MTDHLQDAGESVFDVKTLYSTYNITELLRRPQNGSIHAVAARLGNSKWGYLDVYTNRTAAHDQSGDSTRALRAVAVV